MQQINSRLKLEIIYVVLNIYIYNIKIVAVTYKSVLKRHGERSVEILCSPISAKFWRHWHQSVEMKIKKLKNISFLRARIEPKTSRVYTCATAPRLANNILYTIL